MNAAVEEFEGQVESPAPNMALISAISKAELDQQITTARAFPRSLKKFVTECMDMACLNEQVASECYYVLKRSGKNIEGPSVRLGEIVQSAWGNCQTGARVVDVGDDFVTAQGVFYDLERNVRVTMEVQRRILDKNGRRYNSDMIGVTGNAACSIALRNAIFRGIPKAFWNDIYLAARKLAAGDIKSLVTNRTEALNYVARKGVTQEMVLGALGVAGVEDIGLDELATLRGMITTIKDGEATIETVFAPKEAEGAGNKPKTEAPKSKSAAKAEAAKTETTPATDQKPAADPVHAAADAAQVAAVTDGMNVDQVIVIRDKLKESKVEETLLLAKFEVGKIEDIKGDRFKMVCNWIGAAALG